MLSRRAIRNAASAAFALVLASCATASPISTQTIPARITGSRSATSAIVQVNFLLEAVPATSPASRRVRSLRISFAGNTAPATITLSGSTCSVCSTTLAMPGATRLVYVDALDAAGEALSRTTLNVGPVSLLGAGEYIQLTLASTVSNIGISLESEPQFGKPGVIGLFVAGLSNLNSYIVGPGTYEPPIAVRPDTRFSAMGFAPMILRNSGATVASLHYAGGFQSAAIVMRAGDVTQTALVVPFMSSHAVYLPSRFPPQGMSASGNDVWVNDKEAFAHVDASTEEVKIVKLGTHDAYPGNTTTGPNGTLWYGGCWPTFHGNDRTIGGIGSITPTGATGFVPGPSKREAICAPLSVGPGGGIWFVNQLSDQGPITEFTPGGRYARLAPRADASQSSNVAFANDRTLWTVGYDRPGYSKGQLFHYSATGALIGKYGSGFFQVVSRGDMIFAYNPTQIRSFALSGRLVATYTPLLPTAFGSSLVSAVTSDGAIWFSAIDQLSSSPEDYTFFERIDKDGSYSELVAQNANGMSGLAATANSLWYTGHDSLVRRIEFKH